MQINEVIESLENEVGLNRADFSIMGAESLRCCEITVKGRKYRGATWIEVIARVTRFEKRAPAVDSADWINLPEWCERCRGHHAGDCR